MTQSRESLVSLEATPYYHVTSRCVRRAFLCGYDKLSRQDFSHRREWFVDRMNQLQSIFAIDIAGYTIMSNHYHLVIYIDEESAKSWRLEKVIQRWCQIFKGPHYIQKYLAKETLTTAELEAVETTAALWRERLMDLSWFVRCINEHVARLANQEDQCTGRFWEGRFKSQALMDEKAILACMAYVDLNPIRANMAKTPEKSEHTSVRKRCEQAKQAHTPNHPNQQAKQLMPFVGNPKQDMPQGLPFRLTDYLALVELTGMSIRNDKPGYIQRQANPILQRLGIQPDNWMTLTQTFEESFSHIAGAPESLTDSCALFHRQRRSNLSNCQSLFS